MHAQHAVSEEWVRRAIELADLDAVRVALYQNSWDENLVSLPIAAQMSDRQRRDLIDTAVAWLLEHAGPHQLPAPDKSELRKMMQMVSGEEIGDLEFAARHEITGFRPFPYLVEWDGERPAIPADFKVAIIGSGFAGVSAAVQLTQLGIDFEVFERRPEPGGVWSINRYPDVRVDTSSITYEYLFEKKHNWSEHFARGPEVRTYIADVSKRHGVWDKTRFDHDLVQATFDEARDLWKLDFDTPTGSTTIEANVIISASGLFATPLIPTIEGQENFRGRIVHTARWPDDLDLGGKNVAIMGNGSTGVQMLGALARDADQVFCFQRTPQWISPRDKYGMPMEPEIAWLKTNFPGYMNWWRYSASSKLFDTHKIMLIDREWQRQGGQINPTNDAIRAGLVEYIKRETGGRPDLIAAVTPDYAPFSRRPIVDNGWYRALTRDNVELVTNEIKRLVPEGIETHDGKVREVEVIVTATGFKVAKYLYPARYVGLDGTDLHDSWDAADGPRAYAGMMVPRFPNLFILYGPNSQPLSGGPAQPVWFAVWAAFAAKGIMGMLESKKSRIEVKQSAYERYNAELDKESRTLIQMTDEGGIDKNYYVNAQHGRLQVNAPWYSPYYHSLCSTIRWDDMNISGGLGRDDSTKGQN